MTSLSLENTWNFTLAGGPANSAVNQVLAPAGDQHLCRKRIMWNIKNTLVKLGSFTVKCSSNGTTYGASDKWVTEADIVWAASPTAHSWIVLTNVYWGYDLLIDTSVNGSTNNINYKVSMSAGYSASGGSVGTAPTDPSDAGTIINNGTWIGINTNNVQYVLHGMARSDGKSTRLVVLQAGVPYAAYFMDEIADPVVPISKPVAFTHGYNARDLTYSTLRGSTWTMYRDTTPAWIWGGNTFECSYAGVPISQVNAGIPNDITGNYACCPTGLYIQTSGHRGRIGRFRDLWCGSNVVATGDTYPVASPEFVQFSHMIFPWANGVTPIIT